MNKIMTNALPLLAIILVVLTATTTTTTVYATTGAALRVTENDCSRYPEFLEVRWEVTNLPPDLYGYVLYMEDANGERTIVGGGAGGDGSTEDNPTYGQVGSTSGGFLTPVSTLSEYTLFFYQDDDLNLEPDGPVLATTTFTCEDDGGGEQEDTTEPSVDIIQAVDRKGVQITDESTTRQHYIKITFEASDNVGVEKIECSLDGKALTDCTSPVTYNRLTRGTHEFIVRATDAAGNTDEDSVSWTVSTGNPGNGNGGGRK